MKISYLVSTYDTAHFLEIHLDDLLNNQTDPDFEIVVINPSSPSYDLAVAQKWQHIDSRVSIVETPDYGTYGVAWLNGWMHAQGEFVCNSNADDMHMPKFTEEFYRYAQTFGDDECFLYGGLQVIDEQGQQISIGSKPPFNREVMSRECWAGPQVCWRNDQAFRNKLDWELMFTRAKQYKSAFDYWLWLYFMSLGYDGVVLGPPLTIYMKRDDSIENRDKARNNWETYAAISEFFPHHFDSSGALKHAQEFRDFNNLPEADDWVRSQNATK